MGAEYVDSLCHIYFSTIPCFCLCRSSLPNRDTHLNYTLLVVYDNLYSGINTVMNDFRMIS